jgi:hypothetical protein
VEYVTSGKARVRFTKPIALMGNHKLFETYPDDTHHVDETDAVVCGDRLQLRWNNLFVIDVPMSLVESIVWRSEEV